MVTHDEDVASHAKRIIRVRDGRLGRTTEPTDPRLKLREKTYGTATSRDGAG